MSRGRAHGRARLARRGRLSSFQGIEPAWNSTGPCRGRFPMGAGLRHALLSLLIAILAVAGEARAASEPPLLPLRTFFADPSASSDYRVSPDGSRIAWV